MNSWRMGAALSGLMWASGASAQEKREPIITDRPDFTESTETVPLGMWQLEGGYTFTRVGDERAHSFGELLFRIATGRRTELRIGLNSYVSTRVPGDRLSGFEDAVLGFKVKLVEGAETFGLGRPHVALIGATSLPTGARAFRENNLQPEVKLCLAWDLSERLSMGSNLNYAYVSEGGARYGQFGGSLTFGYSLAERVGSFVEFYGFVPAAKGGPNANYVNGGVTYLVHDDFQLDARAGIGLNSARPDYFVGIGAARRW